MLLHLARSDVDASFHDYRSCEGVIVLLGCTVENDFDVERVVLIDGHPDQLVRLREWLDSRGVELDLVISHFHQDHFAAVLNVGSGVGRGVLEWPQLRTVYCPMPIARLLPSTNRKGRRAVERLSSLENASTRARRQDVTEEQHVHQGKQPDCEDLWIGPRPHAHPAKGGGSWNDYSLIVAGVSLERESEHPVFSFVQPGDAQDLVWSGFCQGDERLWRQCDALRPVAVLKLSHHGADNGSPEAVLVDLFRPVEHPRPPAGQQLAVRIRNAPRKPAGAGDVETWLESNDVPMHDTFSDGEIWVALSMGHVVKVCRAPTAGEQLPFLPSAAQFTYL